MGQVPISAARRSPGPYVTIESISEAFQILMQDFGTWLVCSLIFFFGTQAILQPISIGIRVALTGDALGVKPQDLNTSLAIVAVTLPFNILVSAVGMVMQAGLSDMAYRKQEGYPISVGDAFVGFKKFGQVYAVCVLQLLMMFFGFLLCIIPGMYALAVTPFAPLMVIRKNLGATDALQESYNTLKPQALMSFGVLFLAGLCTALGLVVCCVGILAVLPLQSIVIGINYYNFFPPEILSPVNAEGFTPYPRGYQQPSGFQAAPPQPDPPQMPEMPEMPEIPEPPKEGE